MQQRNKRSLGKILLTILCCWPLFNPVQGEILPSADLQILQSENVNPDRLAVNVSSLGLLQVQGDSIKKKSKVLAAIFAFPYPFGMLGLHRIYLGANPVIPILYIVTLGGFVGILPFVDMMVIILSEDTKPFVKNSKILMWYRKDKKVKATPQ